MELDAALSTPVVFQQRGVGDGLVDGAPSRRDSVGTDVRKKIQ